MGGRGGGQQRKRCPIDMRSVDNVTGSVQPLVGESDSNCQGFQARSKDQEILEEGGGAGLSG